MAIPIRIVLLLFLRFLGVEVCLIGVFNAIVVTLHLIEALLAPVAIAVLATVSLARIGVFLVPVTASLLVVEVFLAHVEALLVITDRIFLILLLVEK